MRYLAVSFIKRTDRKFLTKKVLAGGKTKLVQVYKVKTIWQVIDSHNNCFVIEDNLSRQDAILYAQLYNQQLLKVAC